MLIPGPLSGKPPARMPDPMRHAIRYAASAGTAATDGPQWAQNRTRTSATAAAYARTWASSTHSTSL